MPIQFEDPQFVKAKKTAFNLLKLRNRSQKEIEQKLIQKKINKDIIQQTVEYLKKIKLIDDEIFSREWILSRLNRPFGFKRIFFELKQKGIAESLIKEQIAALKPTYGEEKIVKQLAQRQMLRLKNLERHHAQTRIFAFLSRRGFSIETIKEVVEKL